MSDLENSDLYKSLKNIYFFGGIWTDRADIISKIYFKSIQVIYIIVIFYMVGSMSGTLKLFEDNMNMFGLSMLVSMSAFLDFLRFLVMKKTQFQSIVIDIFEEEKLLNHNLTGESKKRYKESCLWISNLVFFYEISVTFSVFTVFCLSSFVVVVYLKDSQKESHGDLYMKYIPNVVYIPFSISEHYIISQTVTNIFIYFSSFMVCMVDVAFLVPIWYITLRLKILGIGISNIRFVGNACNIDATEEIVYFIEEHQKIIRSFERIKAHYSGILFVATIFHGIQFAPGFLGLLYFDKMDWDLTIQIGGLCYTFSQLFILHWQSQLLTDESLHIGKEIFFGSEWYRMNMKSRKLLLMMLIRAQKPLELTCGPLYPLNLYVFLQVLKRLYTFINIFKEIR